MTTETVFQVAVKSDGGHQFGKVFLLQVVALLKDVRSVAVSVIDSDAPTKISISASASIFDVLSTLSSALSSISKQLEAETLDHVLIKCLEQKSFGGLGMNQESIEDDFDRSEARFLVDAWLEALNSQDKAKAGPALLETKSEKTKPMTLTEKVFAHHTIGGCPVEGLKAGDVVRVSLDWIISSELSWSVSEMRIATCSS